MRVFISLSTPLILCLLLGCDDTDDYPIPEQPILLTPDPVSLTQGDSIIATIRASRPFFTPEVFTGLTTTGGLTLDALVYQDANTAQITVTSTATTELGLHRFELVMSNQTAVLDMTVVTDPIDGGVITATGNTATAGAAMATVVIHGQQTHFDNEIKVSVENAPGFEIALVDVVTEGWIEVMYNIALTQPATEATLVIIDGVYRYDVPFTILSPKQLANLSPPSGTALTKGQVGWITLTHPNAKLHSGTYLVVDDPVVQTGAARVVSATEVEIPVRVPFDYAGTVLSAVAHSRSDGGAMLEMMNVSVQLVAPSYVVATPALLDKSAQQQIVKLFAHGMNLLEVEAVQLEQHEHIVLTDWRAETGTWGEADFTMTDSVDETAFQLSVADALSRVTSTVVVDGFGHAAYVAHSEIPRGDHLYVPIVVKGSDIEQGATTLLGNEDVEVKQLIHIDETCLVAELAVAEHAAEVNQLKLNTGSFEYDVRIKAIDSSL